jgi:hypothetical protein
MRRLLYFIYYIKKLKWGLFLKFLTFTKKRNNKSYVLLLSDIIRSCFQYNISILEFFQFGFVALTNEYRNTWAGTGFMYEFQKKMNPPQFRSLLEDKVIFHKNYKVFMKHIVADIEELRADNAKIEQLLLNPSGKIVFKIKDGGCGEKVLVKQVAEFDSGNIIPFMKNNKYDLVEEFIIQHSSILELAPSAVNTVRIITQLDENNNVSIIACRIRLSVSGFVDNLAAGNIAASIDLTSGLIDGLGIYSDITKSDTLIHPITGRTIKGSLIPYWNEIIEMSKKAALINPINKSVGWDIAVTPNGPTLIEGNREWCKLLFQLPVKQGLKYDLTKFLK